MQNRKTASGTRLQSPQADTGLDGLCHLDSYKEVFASRAKQALGVVHATESFSLCGATLQRQLLPFMAHPWPSQVFTLAEVPCRLRSKTDGGLAALKLRGFERQGRQGNELHHYCTFVKKKETRERGTQAAQRLLRQRVICAPCLSVQLMEGPSGTAGAHCKLPCSCASVRDPFALPRVYFIG